MKPIFQIRNAIFLVFLVAKGCDSFAGLTPSHPSRDSNLEIPDDNLLPENKSDEELPKDVLASRRLFLGSVMTASLVATSTTFPSEAKAIASGENSSEFPSSTLSDAAAAAAAPVDWDAILKKASKKALGGGKAGASAAVVQVLSLMWLRTSMNYQYRYGGDLFSSLNTLWKEGGIPRLYQGLPFAIIQGPATRFGDTAANVGILALLESTPETQSLPLPIKTLIGKDSKSSFPHFLMPFSCLILIPSLFCDKFMLRKYRKFICWAVENRTNASRCVQDGNAGRRF